MRGGGGGGARARPGAAASRAAGSVTHVVQLAGQRALDRRHGLRAGLRARTLRPLRRCGLHQRRQTAQAGQRGHRLRLLALGERLLLRQPRQRLVQPGQRALQLVQLDQAHVQVVVERGYLGQVLHVAADGRGPGALIDWCLRRGDRACRDDRPAARPAQGAAAPAAQGGAAPRVPGAGGQRHAMR
jgi:hypothetical protein